MSTRKFDAYYKAREWLVHYLRTDLEGPAEKDEILTDTPTDTYICGVLYPRSLKQEPDPDGAGESQTDSQDDSPLADVLNPEVHLDQDPGEEGRGDNRDYDEGGVSLANARYPSSLGITFIVDCSVERTVSVSVSAARYEKVDESADQQEADNSDAADGSEVRWRRVEHEIDNHLITLSASTSTQRYEGTTELFEGLEIRCLARPMDAGARIVTLSLVNTLKGDFKDRDGFTFFQPRISVRSSVRGEAVFIETDPPPSSNFDEDTRSAKLLYRKKKVFALGHGCSPEWKSTCASSAATEVSSRNIPEFELHLTDSNGQIHSPALLMKFLARRAKQPLTDELRAFIEGYESWVSCISDEASLLHESELRETAERHIRNMRTAIDRMRSGVDLLDSDPLVLRAFKLANEAMLNTRARDEKIRTGTAGDEQAWYPFQLAFFLLCLKGTVDPGHSDRKVLDLLWFPTGGGKTEAYLALIAFTIMWRRLRFGEQGRGTAVLMRYSMRLLTVQQFERAVRLICACEELRCRNPDLGDQPISIGLYIGEPGSPNRHEGDRGTSAGLQAIKNGNPPETANPKQLNRCPWCGTEFRITEAASDYEILNDGPGSQKTLRISCNNPDCRFSSSGESRRLPVFVVDEDIYRDPPTFVVATVDKFARLSTYPEGVGNLFGIGFDHRPPDLIVQDELHLISGPLGTMTGLYETAVDRLCEDSEGNRPKVIASTATIRNASSQSLALFGRESFQFPPPGLEASDSYFARESDREQKGTRLYLGLFAPGTSPTTLLVRTYAALLQGGKELASKDIDQNVKDAYWTVLGYFNTRRLLASAQIQCRDDVPPRMEFLANRTGSTPRKPDHQRDMWGGTGSGEMTEILDLLDKKYGDSEAVDILMATNMISVGVDISRLGVEAVMGQPLTTSEYIQATSRVGRQYPGLIPVMFNASKSRDRSHYESFVARHSALYKHVETSSLTPFSRSARYRALHAVIVALCRLLLPDLRGSNDGKAILNTPDVDIVRDIIKERVELVDRTLLTATLEDFDQIISRWRRLANDVNKLEYTPRPPYFSLPRKSADPLPLLINPGQHEGFVKLKDKRIFVTEESPFETLTSLRNVDTESSLYIVT